MTEQTETGAITALAAKASGVTVVKTSDEREFLIVPSGFTDKEVSDAYGLKLAKPRYIKQTVTIETADSLVDYVNRFKGEETLLFADIAANRIVALIDYHPASSPDAESASHVAHRAKMELPFSEEWQMWTKISGRLISQLDFARFLEENASDVRAPDAGELLDACRDLQVRRKVNFTKAVRTSTDNENFEYSEETNATSPKKGDIEIPTKFKLGIPVYFGDAETELFAFLRWKLDEGALTLGVQLHRTEHVRQAVFKRIVLDVAERTGCPAVFGRSEN